MSRTKKAHQLKLASNDPHEPYINVQNEHMALWPLAEQLADRIIATLACGCEPFSFEDAETALYHHMLNTTHKPDPNDDEDRRNGASLSAGHCSAVMVAFALGRKIGGARC